jgi:NADH-quinone oxidoreductase subunit G
MRILPRVNEDVNEEWISDKTRHVVDGLRTQRLDQPYTREDGRLRKAIWPAAFEAIATRLKSTAPDRIGAIAGDLATVEEMFALKQLLAMLGSNNVDCRQDGAAIDPGLGRASYLFNATIRGIETADALLIVGSNPRREAAVLNARIRKHWRMGAFPIGVIGERADLTYDYQYLGAGLETLAEVANGKGFGEVLRQAKRPLVIVGQGALLHEEAGVALRLAARAAVMSSSIDAGWNGFSMLHTAAARVGGLDLGFVPGQGGLNAASMARSSALDVLFLLGTDEIDVEPGAFVVYIGSHGDRGAQRADVILAGAAYPEKSGIYVNTEGRVQIAARASFPPGEAREDWAILRALSERIGRRLPYDSLAQLRQALLRAHPHLQRIDQIEPGNAADVSRIAATAGGQSRAPFVSPLDDYYLTNPIARASAVMAECSVIVEGSAAQTAAE